MLFPVQLVTLNAKDECGRHYVKAEGAKTEQSALLSAKPQRPALQTRASSSSSIRSWSSKSSFGRRLNGMWDAMPVYNTQMDDPVFFRRRDGGSLHSSATSTPQSSRAASTTTVPTLGNISK